MEYTQLLKTTWQATWRHKKMWWLGMALLGSGSTGAFRVSLDLANIALDNQTDTAQSIVGAFDSPLVKLWWQDYWWIVGVAVVAVFVLWLLAIVFHLIAQSGLYFGAQQARLGQPVQFSAMVQAGVQSFWRYVGFYLLLSLGKLIAQLCIILNLVLLALTIIGLVVVIPLVMILAVMSLPAAMVLEIFIIYSLQGMTVQHLGSIQTMQHAWKQLWRFPWFSALSYMLIVLIKIVVMVGGLFVALMVITPFAIFAYVAYTSQASLLAVASGCLGLGVLLIIGLVGKGVFVSFQSHFWHRVYSLPQ